MTVPGRRRLDAERTAIRPLGAGDLDEYHDLVIANRAHTSRWDPIRPDYFYSRAGQQDQLRRDEDAWTAGTGYAFAAIDRTADDRIIGRVALGNVVRGPWCNATLGYWIAQDATQAGHGSAAVSLILQFAFERADLHRVQPAIIPRNTASVRLAHRCGFRLEGRALRYLQIAGVWEDHDIYALTSEEWPVRTWRTSRERPAITPTIENDGVPTNTPAPAPAHARSTRPRARDAPDCGGSRHAAVH